MYGLYRFSHETRFSTEKTGKSIHKSNAQRRYINCKPHVISTPTVCNLSTICRQSVCNLSTICMQFVDYLSTICRHFIGNTTPNSTLTVYTLSTICRHFVDDKLLKSHSFKGALVFLRGRLEFFLHRCLVRGIRGRRDILAGCWRRLNPGAGPVIFTGFTAWLIGRSRPSGLLAF